MCRQSDGIPEWFDLRIDRSGMCYPAKVAWRSGDQIGATFLDFPR